MGMVTTIVHNGQELQIKHGWDAGYAYKVGALIGWKPDPLWPGAHIDGVHESYTRDGVGPWVIIKGCVIVAVEARSESADDDIVRLKAKYRITDPARGLWTKTMWEAKAAREAAAEAAYQEWAKTHGDNPVGYFVHKWLREPSCADKLFPAVRVR